jgi:hypothetical protein
LTAYQTKNTVGINDQLGNKMCVFFLLNPKNLLLLKKQGRHPTLNTLEIYSAIQAYIFGGLILPGK